MPLFSSRNNSPNKVCVRDIKTEIPMAPPEKFSAHISNLDDIRKDISDNAVAQAQANSGLRRCRDRLNRHPHKCARPRSRTVVSLLSKEKELTRELRRLKAEEACLQEEKRREKDRLKRKMEEEEQENEQEQDEEAE